MAYMSRVSRCARKFSPWRVIILTLTMIIVALYQWAGQNTGVDRSHPNDGTKPHLVFGILSADGNQELRDVLRNTWISTAVNEDIPFKFTYKFVLDMPTENTLEENKTHGDIVYLNVTNHGYAFKYGQKIFLWLRYILLNFPDASMGARIDDDVFLCVPQIFQRLDLIKSSKLYYGWAYGSGNKISKDRRVDEMFVVVGSELIERLAMREYCYDMKRCNESYQLVELNWGARSLGTWLSIYDDVDFRTDNSRIIHFGRKDNRERFAHYIKPNFCDNYLLYHKSTTENMRQLHTYNTNTMKTQANIWNHNAELPGAITGSLFSGMITRDAPSKNIYTRNVRTIRKDSMKHCDNWAVVTTVFSQSNAVKVVANDLNWCLVIVADTKTPEQGIYLKGIASERLQFLSLKEQYNLYPLLAEKIPLNSFARKNIGYIYAIHHGAQAIWDFDDDNINVIDLNDFNPRTKYATICQDFKSNVVNPYPYFGVRNPRTWPRGFPLQSIKEATSIPKVCKLKDKVMIGIIQSLANVEPDVDAIYRMTNDVPFNFTGKKTTHSALVLPNTVYAPFNAQATLWLSPTFKYMALPASVNGRVSDIWRAYVAQHFMHKDRYRLAFSIPYVTQIRNDHKNIKDFNAELDLYQKSKQLVDFLSSEDALKVQDIMAMYQQLYRRGYLELNDLKFIDAWTKTFQAVAADQRK